MPLQKLSLKVGVNRENTRYTTEGGWYESDKIRFRQGTPEKIGGWKRISTNMFLGVCRSLWNWVTLGSANLMAMGTNTAFYIEQGGAYYDITPFRAVDILTGPFAATAGSAELLVTHTAHGAATGDYVVISGATGLGGDITATVLNDTFLITVLTVNTYSITVSATATASDVGSGGTVTASYEISPGPEIQVVLNGWGAGAWGIGEWGDSPPILDSLRVWTQANFGENLVFGPRGGALYYWVAANGTATHGVAVASLVGANEVPLKQNYILVSDVSRFVFCFGTNDVYGTTVDPMLVRWSDQESVTQWEPLITNQAGSLRLSLGSKIVTAAQSRQEILVWTDTAIYSLQAVGASLVWGAQLLGGNVSISSSMSVSLAGGVAYWMGIDKFYKYDGRVQTLRCDLRRYVFDDINVQQFEQCFATTNEAFNEVWWFYCSAASTTIDRYVVYNYLEDVWYYGTMARTAWIDSKLRPNPVAATYTKNLVAQEYGLDDDETGTPAAIEAYILSSEFDIGDGDKFGFVWRVLPDITFRGSTAANPAVTMTLLPMQTSGSGYNAPKSVGGENAAAVTQTSRDTSVQVEQFTGQVDIRVRGRQLAMRIESNQLGTTWQLGNPRIDIKLDGRR